MTTIAEGSERDILRAARRAWFRAGVKRADRLRLTAELADELEGARSHGGVGSVLGGDPARAAQEWALAQGVTDRRSRIVLLAPSMVAAGALVTGGVLAPLLQAFGNGGHSFMNAASATGVLAIYCGAAALAYLAMIVVAFAVLSMVDDSSRRRSVRALSVALPVGGAIACSCAVASAAALGFDVRPRTFAVVALVVVVTLTATIAVARLLSTRGSPPQPQLDQLEDSALPV